jgi:hypothetical protein
MTEGGLKEWILRRLGKGIVDVELTPESLQDAVDEGKRFYASFFGQAKMVTLRLNQATEYDAALIAPPSGEEIDSVVDVHFPVDGASFNNLWSWAGVDFDPATMAYAQSGQYSALVQYMQYREMGRRIVSADRDWEWDHARRKLIVSPRPDSCTVAVAYLVTFAGIVIEKIRAWEEQLVQDFALGSAMMTLGNIRTKYADKPSATGSFTMDGDILYANGENIRENVIEKARNFVPPTGFWAE